MNIIQLGYPKVRSSVPRQGAPASIRYGHPKSTASKPKQNLCRFCDKGGTHHGNQATCPLKKEWGWFLPVATKSTEIAAKITQIVQGSTEFLDVT